MTEEPYRWLEAMGNRREYVRDQLKGGAPAFAVSLPDGILLLGVSAGGAPGKVFEIHDRLAMAALGHPSDLERVRQAAIDAAHVEAFTRAPEDVSLRRLVAYGLSASVKQNFEQLFSAPVLGEFLFAEVGPSQDRDLLMRLGFDGSFSACPGGVGVVAGDSDAEKAAAGWLQGALKDVTDRFAAARLLLEAGWVLSQGRSFGADLPPLAEREAGWREALSGKSLELGWLRRDPSRAVRYETLSPAEVPGDDRGAAAPLPAA
ncbi:MAG: hypothetical protein KIT22_03910 [Verrucomicrobiae bacterium]|nr:hypothetical protein [Verrucomicrobiae bacterium]